MSGKQRPVNAPSMLLNQNENDSLFQLIGRGCVTLATGVIQLYLADQSDHSKWNKRCCGVACFVKDNSKRSYFIRVYDIKKGQQIWEQELYNQFRYKSPREYFHVFEAHNCAAGLNFASEEEASKFKNAVDGKLQERLTRKREKKRQPTFHDQAPKPQSQRPPNQPQVSTSTLMQPVTHNLEQSRNGSSTSLNMTKKEKKGQKDAKQGPRKLTKADIGAPTEFRHVSHVGWDPNKGFDMNNLDPDMQTLFQQVGITGDDDLDKETVDFIYDFVEKHGGLAAVKQEIQRQPPAPPPTARAPPPPSVQRSPAVPPPPSRSAAPPPPAPPSRTPTPGRSGGPPPPPQRGPPRAPVVAPPPVPNSAPRSSPPAPPASTNRPPPPPGPGVPPPPPVPPPGAPPPPPLPPDTNGVDGGGSGERSALLQAIQAGKALRRVENATDAIKPSNSRGQLLDAIRQGTNLKKVDDQEERRSMEVSSPDMQDGLVGALARALASRRGAVESDEDDSTDEEEDDDMDDDEWDD